MSKPTLEEMLSNHRKELNKSYNLGARDMWREIRNAAKDSQKFTEWEELEQIMQDIKDEFIGGSDGISDGR